MGLITTCWLDSGAGAPLPEREDIVLVTDWVGDGRVADSVGFVEVSPHWVYIPGGASCWVPVRDTSSILRNAGGDTGVPRSACGGLSEPCSCTSPPLGSPTVAVHCRLVTLYGVMGQHINASLGDGAATSPWADPRGL